MRAETLDARAEREQRELRTVIDVAARVNGKRNGAEHPAPRVQFECIADLVATVRPIPWLARGYLERGTTVCYFGEPESGKSLLALDVGLHIASGRAWNGNSVSPGAVFYLGAEGREGLKRRALAWSIRHQVDLAMARFFAHSLATDLSDPIAAVAVGDAVLSIAATYGIEPQLVIVDTLSRHLAGDENSSADMARFITHLDAHVREATGACVLLVHHVGHGDKTRARGSTVLRGAVDTEYRISRDGDSGVVEMSCTKAKDWQRPKPTHFRLSVVDLDLRDDTGEQVTSAVLDATDAPPETAHAKRQAPMGTNQRDALATLRRLQDEHLSRLEENGLPGTGRVSLEDWRTATNLNRYRWRETFGALTERRIVQLEAGYVRIVE